VEPIPTDLTELAARVASVPSVRHALETVDRPMFELLCALAQGPQPAVPADFPEAQTDPQRLQELVTVLWQLGLAWGVRPDSLDSGVHVIGAIRDDLQHVQDRPLELGVALPEASSTYPVAQIDSMGGQHALAAITTVTSLVELWSVEPPMSLKSGGLSVRDLTSVAAHLQVDELTAGFWIELAAAAGLVRTDDMAEARYVPTTRFDTWIKEDLSKQWAVLAHAWIRTDRAWDLVGSNSADHQRLAPLSPALAAPRLARLRQLVLSIIAEVEPGGALDLDSIDRLFADRRPRLRPGARSRIVAATSGEADLLGVISRGALTGLGRALIVGDAGIGELATAAALILPAATDEFLAQADLTLVVPGPPSPALRSLLSLVATLESTGGAAVYRVTPASVARILDTGQGPQDVIDELAKRSVTPLPQPLEYLINDIARRHGSVRVGAVDSYLRSDDEAVISAVLAHPKAVSAGLVRVAPTVVVARARPDVLLEIARSLGHAPVAEGVDGSSVVIPRTIHRAPHDIEDAAEPARSGADGVLVDALVRALVRTEQMPSEDAAPLVNSGGSIPRMAIAASAAALRLAQTTQTPVWIGYADNAGSTTRRLIDVVGFDSGSVSAFDHGQGGIRVLALSRITGVEPVATDDLPAGGKTQ